MQILIYYSVLNIKLTRHYQIVRRIYSSSTQQFGQARIRVIKI